MTAARTHACGIRVADFSLSCMKHLQPNNKRTRILRADNPFGRTVDEDKAVAARWS